MHFGDMENFDINGKKSLRVWVVAGKPEKSPRAITPPPLTVVALVGRVRPRQSWTPVA